MPVRILTEQAYLKAHNAILKSTQLDCVIVKNFFKKKQSQLILFILVAVFAASFLLRGSTSLSCKRLSLFVHAGLFPSGSAKMPFQLLHFPHGL